MRVGVCRNVDMGQGGGIGMGGSKVGFMGR